MRTYFASTSREGTRSFTCPACGHQATARVSGIGEGTATSLNFGPTETAARRAVEHAEADIDRTLAVAACPACGKRNPQATRTWWFKTLMPMVLTTVGIAFLGWIPMLVDINMRAKDKPVVGWIMTGIALVVGIPMTLLYVLPRWSTIDARIDWSDAD